MAPREGWRRSRREEYTAEVAELHIDDWLDRPPGGASRSLWDCLHDAVLHSITSDRMARALVLDFAGDHLLGLAGLPEGARFRFRLEGVGAVRAHTLARWPGPAPQPPSWEGNAEWYDKGRQESHSWSEFEALCNTKGLDVGNAAISTAEGAVALLLSGNARANDEYFVFSMHAERLAVRLIHDRDAGEDFALERLEQLGHDYWAAFAARGQT
jgi:hypothetical protein